MNIPKTFIKLFFQVSSLRFLSMRMGYFFLNKKNIHNKMCTIQTLLCVKQVKQDVAQEWDETMPLPGDIIEGFYNCETDIPGDEFFVPTKAKSELSSQLAKINSQRIEVIWVKVRRGDSILKLQVRVVVERLSMLQKKYSIRAVTDDRHVAVIGDLTSNECTELQEMSRTLVNVENRGFNKRGVLKYDWKMKVSKYLPDHRCTVVSSILFMPMQGEHCTEATTARCMAWFSAAVSSGAPLVFVNIQTEQTVTSEKDNLTGKDMSWSRQHSQQQNHATMVQIVQGIRLWFMPGVAEISLELVPQTGEVRFGLDIKRTEEGLICIYAVAKGSPADRAGLSRLHEEAFASGYLLVMSRLEGKSLMPSHADISGLIHCCDHTEIKDTLVSAIDQMESIQLHVMSWSNQARPTTPTTTPVGSTMLRPRPF